MEAALVAPDCIPDQGMAVGLGHVALVVAVVRRFSLLFLMDGFMQL